MLPGSVSGWTLTPAQEALNGPLATSRCATTTRTALHTSRTNIPFVCSQGITEEDITGLTEDDLQEVIFREQGGDQDDNYYYGAQDPDVDLFADEVLNEEEFQELV